MKTTAKKSKVIEFVRASEEHPYGALIFEFPDGENKVTDLQRITSRNLMTIRKRIYDNPEKCCAIIVYKQGDILSWAKVSKKDNVHISCSSHKCGMCEHCTPSACAKIRDIPYERGNYEESLENYKRIEKYRFVREGVELFNINGGDTSVIYSCNNFEEYYERKQVSLKERIQRIELLRYFFEDVHINNKVRHRDFY